MSFAATWMGLETIFLNEVTQEWKKLTSYVLIQKWDPNYKDAGCKGIKNNTMDLGDLGGEEWEGGEE